MTKERNGIDWESRLKDNEIATRTENNRDMKVVLLAGLQRLAADAGLVWSDCEIITPSNAMIQAIYRVRFEDGTQWVGTADCSNKNTKDQYLNYPTAVAESRAEARCLRKALGIRLLSAEEISDGGFSSIEANPSGKPDAQLIEAIRQGCEDRNIEQAVVIESVIADKTRVSDIYELSQLTFAEAQAAMKWVNDQKVRVLTSKQKRDARKQELLEGS